MVLLLIAKSPGHAAATAFNHFGLCARNEFDASEQVVHTAKGLLMAMPVHGNGLQGVLQARFEGIESLCLRLAGQELFPHQCMLGHLLGIGPQTQGQRLIAQGVQA